MKVPTINQRRVILDPAHGYTVEIAAARREDLRLCDVCGIRNICPTIKAVTRVEKKNPIRLTIRNCKIFRPVIGFAPGAHIFPEWTFNTIRPGTGWRERLKAGQLVTLACAKTMEELLVCEVVEIVQAPMREILEKHAWRNHLMGDVPRKKATERMTEIIRQFYGPHIASPDKPSVAIYLKRTNG